MNPMRKFAQTLGVATCLVGSAHAAIVAEYQVEELSPVAVPELGRVTIIRSGARCMISGESGNVRGLVVYSARSSVVGGTVPLPLATAEVRGEKATGRVPLMPLIGGDLYTWAPVGATLKNGRSEVVNFDAVTESPKNFFEPAAVEHNADGDVARITVEHNGRTEAEWRYEDYKKVENWRIPGTIQRARFKNSGLNIPEDDRIRWKLLTVTTVPGDPLDDANVFAKGAQVSDRRADTFGRTATYNPARGDLESQWIGSGGSAPKQGDPTAARLAIAASILGCGVGIVAVARNLRRKKP